MQEVKSSPVQRGVQGGGRLPLCPDTRSAAQRQGCHQCLCLLPEDTAVLVSLLCVPFIHTHVQNPFNFKTVSESFTSFGALTFPPEQDVLDTVSRGPVKNFLLLFRRRKYPNSVKQTLTDLGCFPFRAYFCNVGKSML